MRKTCLKTIAMLGLFLMLAAGAARAQSGSMIEVKVPFDFIAGTTKLKAGDYTVKRLSRNTLMFRSSDRRTSVMILAPVSVSQGREDVPERLVFTQYGSEYFLNQVWTNRAADGCQLYPSKAESGLAKQMIKTDSRPQKVEIMARRK